MSLAAVNQLNRANILRNCFQPFGVLEQQISALVGARAPRKTEGENAGIEACTGALQDLCEQFLLCLGMRGTNFLERNADRVRSEERRVGKECRSRWGPYQ